MTEALAEVLTDAAPVVVETPVDTGPTEDEALGAAFDRLVTNNGSDRGDDGKFKSAEASPGGEEGAGEDDDVVAVAAPAPANWQGLDEAWKAIPEQHREQVKTHFDDLHRRMSDQGRQLAQVKPIADHLTQAVQKFPQFKGMTPERIAQGAVQLAGLQARMESSPQEALSTVLEVAQTYGVLPQLQAKLAGKELPAPNDEISGLKREVADLKQRLQQTADPSQIETQVARVVEGRAAQDVVSQFAEANPLWPLVEPHIVDAINSVKEAESSLAGKALLEKAYEQVIDAFPPLKAAREAAARPAAAEADAARTAAAKKAAGINVKSTSTGKERQMTEQEALAAAYDRAVAS